MIRKFINIKGRRFDLWEIKSIEPHQWFPEHGDDWCYGIMLNREGIATNLNGVVVECDDEEDMLATIQNLKERLEEDESIAFL